MFILHSETAIRVEPGVLYTSPVASHRLRTYIPACGLASRAPVWLMPLKHFLDDPQCARCGKVRAIVLTKFPSGDLLAFRTLFEELLRVLETRSPDTLVIADFTDNLAALADALGAPFLREFQQRLSRLCPLVTPCEALASALKADATHGVTVIEDPYESLSRGTIRAPDCKPLRLLWFGHFGEPIRAFLERELERVLRECQGVQVELEFITAEDRWASVGKLRRALTRAMPSLRFVFTPWSLESVDRGLGRCDIAVLPQDVSSPAGRVKSHNRLVAAIRAGRFAVASPIPAYLELSQFAWVSEDLASGIAWALQHPEEVAERLNLGQQELDARFSPKAVTRKWAELLGFNGAA